MKRYLLVLLCSLFLVSSCNNGETLPQIPGVKGPAISIVAGKMLISISLLNVNIVAGGKIAIPHTRDSSFEVAPNILDGGTILQFTLDPEEIKGVTVADDPNSLPDGRPLPGIPGGVLPSLRVDTELFKTTYYFGKSLFGFYIPFKLNTQGFGLYYPLKVNGNDTGLLGLVASDVNGQNSGFVIFLRLNALKKQKLKKLFEMSERNPHKVYHF